MDIFYLVTYFLLWVVTFIIYWSYKQVADAGWIIMLSFLVNAGMAIWLYSLPAVYYDFKPIRFFPFVYLFLMLFLALWPVARFNTRTVTSIEQPDMWVLHVTACFIILFSVLSIPGLLKAIQGGGIMDLLSDADMGKDMYSESMQESENSGSGIQNLVSIVVNAMSDITILLFFYYLSLPKRNWVIIAGLFVSTITYMLSPILSGLRGGVVTAIFTFVVAYFLLRPYYTARLRQWIDMAGLILVIVVSIPIAAITMSRFGEKDGGAMYSVVYYAGQAPINFNNYGLDAGGIRYGDRTFNLVKRVFDSDTPKNYVERRNKYYKLKMDDDIFYTFVGDFTLDFGPYIAPIIFLIFTSLIVCLTKPKQGKIAFYQLILIYFVACICMQGGMVLFSYSDTAGLKVITLLCLSGACYLARNTEQKTLSS